jgi:hypothetical protein
MREENLTCLLALKDIRDFGLKDEEIWAFRFKKEDKIINQIIHTKHVDGFYQDLLRRDPFVIIYDLTKYQDSQVA